MQDGPVGVSSTSIKNSLIVDTAVEQVGRSLKLHEHWWGGCGHKRNICNSKSERWILERALFVKFGYRSNAFYHLLSQSMTGSEPWVHTGISDHDFVHPFPLNVNSDQSNRPQILARFTIQTKSMGIYAVHVTALTSSGIQPASFLQLCP